MPIIFIKTVIEGLLYNQIFKVNVIKNVQQIESARHLTSLQKRCLNIIYPKLSCSEALEKSGLTVRLDTRREDITQSTFKELKCPTHPLHYMLPPRKVSTSQMILRPTFPFSAPKCKKTRYGRDLIPHCIAKKY